MIEELALYKNDCFFAQKGWEHHKTNLDRFVIWLLAFLSFSGLNKHKTKSLLQGLANLALVDFQQEIEHFLL